MLILLPAIREITGEVGSAMERVNIWMENEEVEFHNLQQ